MFLNPYLYQKLVRPKFAIKKYIQEVIQAEFDFRDKKVLDFACGTGSYAFIFEPENYLGVDIDQSRVDFARKNFPGYHFETIKNGIIPADKESFDFVVVIAAIHHISDNIFSEYVKEFSRVLKPGGTIVVIEPVISAKHKISNWFMNAFDDGGLIREEKQYLDFFNADFIATVHKRFRKFLFYNELFFSARKK